MDIPAQITVPFAQNGMKNAIPVSGSDTDANASFQQGFPPRTMSEESDAVAPSGQDMNGILNTLSLVCRYAQAGGVYPFSGTFAQAIGGYPIGATVRKASGSGRWRNTVAGNMNNPDTGGEGWVPDDAPTMPVGAIYVQFSGQTDPTTLFGGTWENVSSTYAGLFFRAEGGAAAAFGETQGGGAPNITGGLGFGGYRGKNGDHQEAWWGAGYESAFTAGVGPSSNAAWGTVTTAFDAGRSDSLYGASEEVRPVNSTIRIWKRTA